MKIKFLKIAGVFGLSLLFFPEVYGQTLLTQAFVSSGGGVYGITNSLNLTIVGGTSPRSHQPLLFQNVLVQTGDVGQVYTLGLTDDPADFTLITHYLTDGIVDYLGYQATVGSGGGGRSGVPEALFFSSLPSGSNGIDLEGFNIDYYTLVFTSLDFESPGSDPNNNGLWTDYSYSARFSVYGEPVPEPASLTVICLVLSVLFTNAKSESGEV
jgi:hypothetical protein